MDKHQVKIKINGKSKPYSSEEKSKEMPEEGDCKTVQSEVTELNDFTEEDLPLIIVDEMAAAAEKKEEEDFEWVLPKEPPKKEESADNSTYIEDLRHLKNVNGSKTKTKTKSRPTPFGKKKKLAPPSFSKQLFVSITMAIGIGTCLGFIILAIMNMSNTNLNPDVPAIGPVAEGDEDDNTPVNTDSDGNVSVTIPAQSVAVLQGGAYSSADGADAEIQKLKNAGFSAVSIGSDPIYVLIAVGHSVEGMKAVGGLVQEKGFEPPYAKELALSEKTLKDLSEQDANTLQDGQSLYKELAAASTLLLNGGSIDAEATEKIEAAYDKVKGIKDDALSEAPKQWKGYLTGAYESFQEFQSTSDKQKLWDVQQKLLDATAILN